MPQVIGHFGGCSAPIYRGGFSTAPWSCRRGGAANESQNTKRKTQSRVCSAEEPQKKIKRQKAKGKSEKPYVQKPLPRKQGITVLQCRARALREPALAPLRERVADVGGGVRGLCRTGRKS
jgi:hypothetical protein